MQRLPNTPEGETKPIGFRLPPPTLAMIDREVAALRAGVPEAAAGGITRSAALRSLLTELEQRRAADPSRAPTGDGREGERIAAAAAEVRRILAKMDTAGAELRGLLEGGAQQREGAQRGEVQRGERGAHVREVSRGGDAQARQVLHAPHTAAGGQLSLLTRTANDGAEALAGNGEEPPKPSETRRATPRASAAANSLASAEVLAALKPRLVAAHAAGRSLSSIGRESGVDPACLTRWVKGTRPGVSNANAHKLAEWLERLGV